MCQEPPLKLAYMLLHLRFSSFGDRLLGFVDAERMASCLEKNDNVFEEEAITEEDVAVDDVAIEGGKVTWGWHV